MVDSNVVGVKVGIQIGDVLFLVDGWFVEIFSDILEILYVSCVSV